MKASVVLAASVLMAPGLGSVLMTKSQNQMNEYDNMQNCKNRKKAMHEAAPQRNKCYDMQDNSQAFYYQYGDQYQPQMYHKKGCKGKKYDPPKNECCDRGNYQSYMMVGNNTPRDATKGEEGKKKGDDKNGKQEEKGGD